MMSSKCAPSKTRPCCFWSWVQESVSIMVSPPSGSPPSAPRSCLRLQSSLWEASVRVFLSSLIILAFISSLRRCSKCVYLSTLSLSTFSRLKIRRQTLTASWKQVCRSSISCMKWMAQGFCLHSSSVEMDFLLRATLRTSAMSWSMDSLVRAEACRKTLISWSRSILPHHLRSLQS